VSVATSPRREDDVRVLSADPNPFEGDRMAVDWPVPLTTLVGREQETAAVLALLDDDTVRLLTLTGPGGVGKTRLALQVGAALGESFPDGVVFVTLAPIVDQALVLPTIARVFDVRDAGNRSPLDRLRHALRPWHGLLILDNFEQVIDAAPLVSELLASCPRLKV
jgi:predicted ATPase